MLVATTDTPAKIKKAALQLHFDSRIWDQIATIIQRQELNRRTEQAKDDTEKMEAERQAKKKAESEAAEALRKRRGSTGADSTISGPDKWDKVSADDPMWFQGPWTVIDTEYHNDISYSSDNVLTAKKCFTMLFGVYIVADRENAVKLHGRNMKHGDHPEGAKPLCAWDPKTRSMIRKNLRRARRLHTVPTFTPTEAC